MSQLKVSSLLSDVYFVLYYRNRVCLSMTVTIRLEAVHIYLAKNQAFLQYKLYKTAFWNRCILWSEFCEEKQNVN